MEGDENQRDDVSGIDISGGCVGLMLGYDPIGRKYFLHVGDGIFLNKQLSFEVRFNETYEEKPRSTAYGPNYRERVRKSDTSKDSIRYVKMRAIMEEDISNVHEILSSEVSISIIMDKNNPAPVLDLGKFIVSKYQQERTHAKDTVIAEVDFHPIGDESHPSFGEVREFLKSIDWTAPVA